MSSREEEKRKRREARMAAEAAAKSAHDRARRIQYLIGGLLAIAVVVAIAVGATSGSNSKPGPASAATGSAKIPPASDPSLPHAAQAAGCVLVDPPIQGRGHVTSNVVYKSNPPTSGPHNPIPAQDGI